MHPPSRVRRILKWTGTGAFVLILIVWGVSIFAGVRIVVPIGSIAISRGIVEIVQSPSMAELEFQHALANTNVKDAKEYLRRVETSADAPAWLFNAARERDMLPWAQKAAHDAEDGKDAHAAIWGIPLATTPGQSMGILWLKPYGPRLSRPGLGLRLPTYLIQAPPGYWSGVWIPLWLIALVVAVSWGIIRWRHRPIPPGHCTSCGYDLTGNISGVCSECGMAEPPPATG